MDGTTYYRDADGDGFGNLSFTSVACAAPTGFVVDATDCLDSAATVYPGAAEVCDGLDNDCDGAPDVGATDAGAWYTDADGDGFGDEDLLTAACNQPAGTVNNPDDCDDADASINPGAVETCDGVDEDCDTAVDEDAVGQLTTYVDADGDGVGAGAAVLSCSVDVGSSLQGDDCDDADANSFPGATEQCDGADNDCDSVPDGPNPAGAPTWYLDFDGDGSPGSGISVLSCVAPAGYGAVADDCDDGRADVYPGAPELCDGVDNNCNSATDENVTNPPGFYLDDDGDGYGDPATGVFQCQQPAGTGWTTVGGDCDDTRSTVFPGAVETCDGEDDDCDGATDEDDAINASTWFLDADADGWGNAASTTAACDQPAGYVLNDQDCNDLAATAGPNQSEICDGIDNNCDGDTDDGDAIDAVLFFLDGDGDGYGLSNTTVSGCVVPAGYAEVGNDCDDAVVAVNPMAAELCDTIDNDCDGATDESSALDADLWFQDADADGFGAAEVTQYACSQPTGYVADSADCNDGAASVSPAGVEVCNGVDDDCSGFGDDNGASCPCDVEYGFTDGDPYLFCTTELNWQDARDECASLGYHLLTVNDALENIFADGVSDTFSNAKWWIGLNDILVEDDFVWEDGSPATYTNWHPGEPNNVNGGEDCTQFNRYQDQTWNDEPCAWEFMYICEFD